MWALNPMTKCPNKSETKGELIEGRGGGSVTSEAGTGVM